MLGGATAPARRKASAGAGKQAPPPERSKSDVDLITEEFKAKVAASGSRFVLPRATPAVYISSTSNRKQVRDWLDAKNFSNNVIKKLGNCSGAQLFKYTKFDLQTLIGHDDGNKLYSQILVQKSICGYDTASRSTQELHKILARRKEHADEFEQSSLRYDTLPPDYNYHFTAGDDDDLLAAAGDHNVSHRGSSRGSRGSTPTRAPAPPRHASRPGSSPAGSSHSGHSSQGTGKHRHSHGPPQSRGSRTRAGGDWGRHVVAPLQHADSFSDRDDSVFSGGSDSDTEHIETYGGVTLREQLRRQRKKIRDQSYRE